MAKQRRPFQDESLIFPAFRHLYSACFLGRPDDPHHEEPIKYTQTLNEQLYFDSYNEWIARFNENAIAADMFIRGEMADEAQKMSLLTGVLDETGLDSTVEDMETGAVEAMDGVDKAVEVVSDTEVLELMDEVLTIDMVTTYAMHPPIIQLPISLGASVLVMLFGHAYDCFYHNLDSFTMEGNGCLWDWHLEDGIQTANTWYMWESAMDILERRHMRTGEKFRYLCVQRPSVEGENLCIDILMDVRNERFPQYSDSEMIGFPYTTLLTPDSQCLSRSLFDFMSTVVYGGFSDCFGWPNRPYVLWYPRPGIIEMLIPIFDTLMEMVVPKMVGLLTGVNLFMCKYNLTHLETTVERVGQEMIIPLPDESSQGYMRYGMDRIRYPQSMVQSKRAYGQEAHMRAPTKYPLPEGINVTPEVANEEIKRARKEHPEWLTSIKGFGN